MKLGVAVFFMLLAAVTFSSAGVLPVGDPLRPVLFDTNYYFSDHLWTWHNHAAKHTCWDHGVPC